MLNKAKDDGPQTPCSPWMYPGQEYLQKLFLFAALICVPWMLLAKPIIIMRRQKKLDASVN